MPTRSALTDRVTPTLERSRDTVTETITDLSQRGGRRARKEAHERADAARQEASRLADEARKRGRREAKRQRKSWFRRRKHVQALVAERIDGLKSNAADAASEVASSASGRAADVASSGADHARALASVGADKATTLGGEARSWLVEQAAGIDLGEAAAALAPTGLSKKRRRRPLTTLAIGAAAGVAGTAVLDAAQRRSTSGRPAALAADHAGAGHDAWRDAPISARLGKRIWEDVLHQDTLNSDKVGFASNVSRCAVGLVGVVTLIALDARR